MATRKPTSGCSARPFRADVISNWLAHHQVPESAGLMFTALLVGAGAGFGAVIFRRLIEGVQRLSYEGLGVLLGVVAAILAVGFTRLLYFSEDAWDRIWIPEYIKPVLGGLALGVIGIPTYQIDGFPRVFGVGYASVADALFGRLTLQLALGLMLLKALATVTPPGSGGSGGVFAPSLFIGAMMGEAFGRITNLLFPAVTAPPGAYTLVGMAVFFSSAAHASMTAILILFEMTGNYQIILPLMLATVMGTLVSRVLSRESIYTLKLSRRGVHLQEGTDIDIMQGVTVAEAMSEAVHSIDPGLTANELAQRFQQTHHHGLPVVDDQGVFRGVVSIKDLAHALGAENPGAIFVKEIATMEGVLVAYPDEPMWVALKRLGTEEFSLLPVVARDDPTRLLGVIRRRNVIHAYNQAIARHARGQHRAETLRLGKLDDSGFIQIDIHPESSVIGMKVSAITLPQECLIVAVRRGKKLTAVHVDTLLQAGDRLTVFADEKCVPAVEEILAAPGYAHAEPAEADPDPKDHKADAEGR